MKRYSRMLHVPLGCIVDPAAPPKPPKRRRLRASLARILQTAARCIEAIRRRARKKATIDRVVQAAEKPKDADESDESEAA